MQKNVHRWENFVDQNSVYNAMETSVILYFTSDFCDNVKLNSEQGRVHVYGNIIKINQTAVVRPL